MAAQKQWQTTRLLKTRGFFIFFTFVNKNSNAKKLKKKKTKKKEKNKDKFLRKRYVFIRYLIY